MDGERAPPRGFHFSPILICVLVIMVGSMIVATYHFISLGCCGRCYNRQAENNEPNTLQDIERNDDQQQQEWPRDRIRSSSVMRVLMPVLRYSKDCNEEDTCAVCLGEFKEGEQVRVLPECLHLFHVPCIDMWLSSHSNCPLCRANAAPPPPPSPHLVLTWPDAGDAPPPEFHREQDFVV